MSKLIQWPRAKYWDRAWNPVIGCRPVSPACENCYARKWAERFGHAFIPHETKSAEPPRSGVVFCGNLTDLFGEWVRTMQIFDWFTEMWTHDKNGAPRPIQATYLWLTKRAGRMGDCIANYTQCPNAYFGITAESRELFDSRMYALASTCDMKKARWWLSCEPLLGPMCLVPWKKLFSWVVVGCESGPHRRPCKIEWVEKIVEECMAAGVPVFVKQLDLGGRCVTDIGRFPEHLRVRQVPWGRTGAARQDMDGRMS